jgi:hypothetical protein
VCRNEIFETGKKFARLCRRRVAPKIANKKVSFVTQMNLTSGWGCALVISVAKDATRKEEEMDYLEEMDTVQLWKFLTLMRNSGLGTSELAGEIETIMINRLWNKEDN